MNGISAQDLARIPWPARRRLEHRARVAAFHAARAAREQAAATARTAAATAALVEEARARGLIEDRICSHEDCPRPVRAKGMCDTHYRAARNAATRNLLGGAATTTSLRG